MDPFPPSIPAPASVALSLRAPVCLPVLSLSFCPPILGPARAVIVPRGSICAPAIAIPFEPPVSALPAVVGVTPLPWLGVGVHFPGRDCAVVPAPDSPQSSSGSQSLLRWSSRSTRGSKSQSRGVYAPVAGPELLSFCRDSARCCCPWSPGSRFQAVRPSS